MSTPNKAIHSDSMAIIPYNSQQSSEEFLQSEIERITNEVFKRTIKISQFEKVNLFPIDLNPLGVDSQMVLRARNRRFEHILPSLKGSYPVGHTTVILKRPKEILGDNIIGIEVYAPSETKGEKLFFLRKEHELETALLSQEQLHSLFSHSHPTMKPIKKMPVIIFSHGLSVDPIEYRLLLENIASYGYVVLCLNHPSSSGFAPFSKKAYNEEDLKKLSNEEFNDYADRLAYVQASNIEFVINLIWSQDLFKDSIELDKIILAGHSLGGEASIIVANSDPRVTGCINLDGLAGNKETRQKGLQNSPVLTILSDKDLWQPSDILEAAAKEQYMKDWKNFHEQSTDSEMLTLKNSTHMDFCSFWPIITWLLGNNEVEMPLKTHAFTSYKILEFIKSL